MSTNTVYLAMAIASVFWSGAFITGKLAVGEFPAFALTFFRFAFALPVIFLLLYLRQPEDIWPKREQWKPLIFLGFVGTFLYHGLFFSALKYTTAINSSLIGSTNPMITTVLAVIFFHEQITPLRVFGIALSFFGVFLVISNGNWDVIANFRFNYGDILMFVAVCSWAVYSLMSRRYMGRYQISPLALTAYTFLICTIISIPFVIWEQPMTYLPYATVGGWLSILYMAIFASVLGYLIHMIAVQRIGASKASIFINLVPVFTIIQSVLFLGETFTLFKCISAGIIIVGVYLTTRPGPDHECNAGTTVEDK